MLEKPLQVASVVGPRPDPAFDTRHPEWLSLAQKYARTRAPADLEKLPLKEGKRPRLFSIEVLTPKLYARLDALPEGSDRDIMTVCLAVLRVRHSDGHFEDAPIVSRAELGPVADVDKWPATLQRLGGMKLIAELASVVMQRAEAGDADEAEGADPLDLYALPRGLLLAR